MGKMSRQKGKRGEREVAAFLTERGFPARRGRQFKGTDDSPDVICEDLDYLNIEVKYRETYSVNDLRAWLDKAVKDDMTRLPIIFHKRNGTELLVTMAADDFIQALEGR